MNAFAAATDAIFADRNMSVEVGYLRGGLGPLITVRGIIRAPTDTFDQAGYQIATDTLRLSLRVADAPDCAEGDSVILNGTDWHVITGQPLRDSHGLMWSVTLVAQDRE